MLPASRPSTVTARVVAPANVRTFAMRASNAVRSSGFPAVKAAIWTDSGSRIGSDKASRSESSIGRSATSATTTLQPLVQRRSAGRTYQHHRTTGEDPTSASAGLADRGLGSAAEIGEDGEDTTVVVVGGLQAELKEDRRGVLGHSPLGDHHPLGDRRVGPALGHQLEHLQLPRAEA